ncbi:D-2-hydroxyacid dehydrogenase family protein [Streptomyces lunaelactis]|uniref:D-2-hydroxyacid dehydrogenase family protein n=1 Tax=Streptomyces lunaelactis TaxID=1535768 RepID=UPI0015848E77|nr:D-2-hydroxyacid dehydrogenase family protein [Streptomyces lunaelactis]NUK04277.1 D-2-hydroxyacid dehydrogenase family protein [Streptomyces lunaelactis]NUK19982.1 D-2-hydroxyacid dehydrogenase family protein [Streptomyces lunaelactis]
MTLHCAVLDDYQDVALSMADWSALGSDVEVTSLQSHFTHEDEVVEAVGDCEILVAMRERTPFTASLFARLPRLQLLITSGMRNASIDLEAAARHGVTVCGTSSSSEPPAELTWALILGLARHVVQEGSAFRDDGPWQSTVGADLHGSRLALLGLGRIGAKVARVGQAFGMEVMAWSRHLTDERAAEVGVVRAHSLGELLEAGDFVSVHLQLGDRTRGLIGAKELKRMRRTAYLVNTSRAAIVDQAALVRALHDGWIAGAGADVFETEPLPEGDPLRSAPNFLGLPHLGYVTRRNYEGYFRQAVEDIAAYLAGRPVRTLGPSPG